MTTLAQKVSVEIAGTVMDESNEPIIGAYVTLPALKLGTVTDFTGQYRMVVNAPLGENLVEVSYLSYETSTNVLNVTADQTIYTLDVALREDLLNLDEIVVVGSTLQAKRKQLGNALTSINADELIDANPQSVTGALQGKIAGAQIVQNSGDPAGGFSVRLRGASTFLGSSEPLVVIDGVVVNNSTTNVTNINATGGAAIAGTNRLADINPNDIADIVILNGSAAAAQYGSRASNGVMLITTKRGKAGKPRFSFSSGFNVNEIREKVYINTRGEQFGSAEQRLYPIAGTDPVTGGLTVGANFSTDKVPVTRYDYQDEIFQVGFGVDQNLSVSGGNESSSYYASLSYLDNEGIVKNTDFRRYGARLRYNQTLSQKVTYSVGLNYNNSFSNEKPDGNVFWSPINSINITNNIWDITERDAAGNLQSVEPTRVNPLSVIEDFDITQEVNRSIADINIKYFPFEGMLVDFITGVDATNQNGDIFIPPYPYAPVNPGYFNDGYASTANNNAFLVNTDINLSYNRDLSGNLTSTTSAGYSHQFIKGEYSVTQGRGLAPFVRTVNGASIILNPQSNISRTRIWGYYLQQTFGLGDKLFLTAAGRFDGSSSFGPDNRSNFYPKLSASYVLSDEDFWKNSLGNSINVAKVRVSWGKAGNLTAIGPYDRFDTYLANNLGGSSVFNQSNTLANNDVKPEIMTELEVGLDMSFLKSRLGLGFTWYKQEIDDLLVNRALAASQGGTNITTNVGSLENTGIEVVLDAAVVKKKDMSWNLGVNFSSNKNKVTNLGQGQVEIPNVTGAPIFLVDGEPLGVFFGTYTAKDANGNDLLTADGFLQQERGDETTNTPMRQDGQPTGTPLRKVIGDPNPDYILGINTAFRYKKLTLTAVIESVQGVDVFDADKRTRQGVGIGEFAEKELTGELPRGWVWSIYPILDWRISDGSFTKIRELSLEYDLGKIGGVLENASISIGARNLYSFDNFTSYDPETNSGGQSNVMRAVNFGTVPIPRTYTVTLKADF
jgi:TonB-linked SusC/RagA family outer membrane protein